MTSCLCVDNKGCLCATAALGIGDSVAVNSLRIVCTIECARSALENVAPLKVLDSCGNIVSRDGDGKLIPVGIITEGYGADDLLPEGEML